MADSVRRPEASCCGSEETSSEEFENHAASAADLAVPEMKDEPRTRQQSEKPQKTKSRVYFRPTSPRPELWRQLKEAIFSHAFIRSPARFAGGRDASLRVTESGPSDCPAFFLLAGESRSGSRRLLPYLSSDLPRR
jgi:hypothetical protein